MRCNRRIADILETVNVTVLKRVLLGTRHAAPVEDTVDDRLRNGNQKERHKTMIGAPVDLDKHRGMAAQEMTDMRRVRLKMFQVDQAALRCRQEELEQLLHAAPAETWPEAAAKTRYLIKLFASTPEAQDPRRKELITRSLDDLARLCDCAKEKS